MPNTKITLFAQSPVQIGGERYFEEEFEVETQKQADELIACGAAVDPDAVAKALDKAEQAEAEKAEAEKTAAEKKPADKKIADINQSKGKAK